MIYNYKKYKNVEAYVKGVATGLKDRQFTILHKCAGCDNAGNINGNCFGCLFCAMNSPEMLEKLKNNFGFNFVGQVASEAFRGTPVRVSLPQKGLKHPYSSLEKFTAVDETTNIQPWATGLLHFMCSKDNRISMEVPAFNLGYDRNGRLDICSITDEKLIVMESKTTVDDALNDERFIEQHKKYTEVINETGTEYTYLTLVGGKETDVYPETSKFCSGIVGGKSRRFIELLATNGIQAITANALWCLCCKYLTEGETYSWDKFLVDIFSDPECMALVSAGIIKKVNGEPKLLPLL